MFLTSLLSASFLQSCNIFCLKVDFSLTNSALSSSYFKYKKKTLKKKTFSEMIRISRITFCFQRFIMTRFPAIICVYFPSTSLRSFLLISCSMHRIWLAHWRSHSCLHSDTASHVSDSVAINKLTRSN